MREFLLGIESVPQPMPHKNPGGDCFACALTAALRHLFPERPVEFETAWNYFTTGRRQLNNTWPGMRRALYKAYDDGYPMTIEADMVQPHFDPERLSHNWWRFVPEYDYTRRLDGYLRGGWIAFAETNYEGTGPYTPDGKLNTPNHFVLVDGTRESWDSVGSGSRALRHYVHVVCSAKGPYWIRTHDFLVKHGAAAWWLARREEGTE